MSSWSFCADVREIVLAGLSSYASLLMLGLLHRVELVVIHDPDLPPRLPGQFVTLLSHFWTTLQYPPQVDAHLVSALAFADAKLRSEGDIAPVSPPTFRIPLLAINSWHKTALRLVHRSDPATASEPHRALAALHLFLEQMYDDAPALDRILTLSTIHATAQDHAVFYIFAALVRRRIPRSPFLDLCNGLEVDANFMPQSKVPLAVRIAEGEVADHLPIKTRNQMEEYATMVFGSFVAAYVHLAFSSLAPADAAPKALALIPRARELGHALGLVAISHRVRADAARHRLYIPLSAFSSASELFAVISGAPPPVHLVLPLLDQADAILDNVGDLIAELPRQARGRMRGMVRSALASSAKLRRAYA